MIPQQFYRSLQTIIDSFGIIFRNPNKMQEKAISNTKIKINDMSLERLQFDTLYSQEMQEYDENPEQFTPWFQQKNKADSLKHQLEGQNHKFFAKIKFTSKQTSIISESQRLVVENQSKALQYLKRNLTNKLSREGVRQISQKYHSLSPPAKFIEKRRNLYRKSKIGSIYHKPKMIDLKLGNYKKQLQQNEAENLLRSEIKNKKSFKISQKKQISPFSPKEDPHPRLENYVIQEKQDSTESFSGPEGTA